MSEDRLKQSITDKGYEFVKFADDNDKCYSFSNRNASQVVLKLKCNHEKTVKVSTVYCKELVCITCKNKNKYNYNVDTKEKTCSSCGHIHKNYCQANLSRFKCYMCEFKKNPDLKLYRLLVDKKFTGIMKNYRYYDNGKKTKRTGDLYLDYGGCTVVIEVDDVA
jgi:hypothetical protein